MLLKQFPDLQSVRQLRNDATAGSAQVWKNVALNVKCKQAYRTGVESPYSLFLNVKGHSYCAVNGSQYRIETDTFLLTQPGEHYDLIIDNMHQTEVFNVHINRNFFLDFARSRLVSETSLLNNPFDCGNIVPDLFTQLYNKNAVFNSAIARLGNNEANEIDFEAALTELLDVLLMTNDTIKKTISGLPAASRVVQEEIYRRLMVAKDYIHSNYFEEIDLDALCREATMSKFHFLRLFKALYGITPYQYIAQLRIDKARHLLKATSHSITEIADELGFDYPNSFIKSFQKHLGVSPLRFRKTQEYSL